MIGVLGPTNTGKTHFAVERLLAHRTGMMGFPLRLLAREVYDRIVAQHGPGTVALITGEERRLPKGARYFICTTEAMPVDREVAFLAVDEVQLAADPERGHVFTDRILRARGTEETMFLGSDTIRPLLKRLVPEIEIVSRPRFSVLSHIGPAKLTRMPRRSAIVAFRTSDVYRLAEILRRHKGGAAVVLGALSPRTRNAQVAMYQAGEVDHMVATDAIGMGLNMDLVHVAFAQTQKFDGREQRALHPHEAAQIAGRAGRHMTDGTFGSTHDVGSLDERMVEAIEAHNFAPLRQVYWRNGELDFTSLDSLRRSLETAPVLPGLIRKRDAIDDLALRMLAGRTEVRRRAHDRDTVRLLWQVCQIPDFTKTLTDNHVHLLARIYDALTERGRLPVDWVADKITRLDRVDGDIDTLTARLAHVRTWTYVSHRERWLDDAAHWQERAQAVEDRLSDALHERLTQRFVDRRTSALLRSIHERKELMAAVTRGGEVLIDGHGVGHMAGLDFIVDTSADTAERRLLQSAARRVLGPEVSKRAAQLVQDGDDAFGLDGDLTLNWRGHAIARLVRGSALLSPRVAVADNAHLDGKSRAMVEARLQAWVGHYLDACLRPLLALRDARVGGAGRGLAFRLTECLGNVATEEVRELVDALSPADRRHLSRIGVRFGVHNVYLPATLKPNALQARAHLWRLHRRGIGNDAPADRVVLERQRGLEDADYVAIGFEPFRTRALRVDVLERLAARLRERCRSDGSFVIDAELGAASGLAVETLAEVVHGLGYRRQRGDVLPDGPVRYIRPSRRSARRRRSVARTANRPSSDSPFAVLRELRLSG
ncbi:helicase-related protein [Marinivivus vitaminiproducens]|uniref:helicase-related protein n=1 Tax=Marinivivus vitaminiproducens TaxID=3035935 RepID=UPI0027A3FCFA|nr:helicase-related protein [Geminicoccaceae bacterium SCSIO 64248]